MVPAASRRLAEKKTLHQVPDQEQAGEQGKGMGEEMIQRGKQLFLCKIHIIVIVPEMSIWRV